MGEGVREKNSKANETQTPQPSSSSQPHGGTALVLERASIDVDTLLTSGDAPLDPSVIKTLTRSVLAALAAAHAAGVAHRDVKPGNVLLTECGRVVLGDWGQADAIPLHEDSLPPPPPALALPAAPGGTRWYRPPEALAGGPAAVAPGVGAAADAWGAGALLAALLARGPLAAARSDVGQLARWGPFVGGGDGCLVDGGDGGGGVCPAAAAAGWRSVGDAADADALASALPDAPPAALTLVARLLAPDPASRLAPAAALESEWLWEAPAAATADAVAAAVAVAAARRPARVASAVALL